MYYNSEIEIDLSEVKNFIEAPSFHQYLLEHAPSFETAAFILQSLLNAVDSAAQQIDIIENI